MRLVHLRMLPSSKRHTLGVATARSGQGATPTAPHGLGSTHAELIVVMYVLPGPGSREHR